VVVKDEELEGYERTAQAVGLSMSEWVRQSLRAAERQVSTGDVEAKLAAIRWPRWRPLVLLRSRREWGTGATLDLHRLKRSDVHGRERPRS
jgi:hypothetical protein